VLEARGYNVDSSSNGKEGLEKRKTFLPDLILLDVMMTTKTEGFDVSREFSKDDALKSIIYCSPLVEGAKYVRTGFLEGEAYGTL